MPNIYFVIATFTKYFALLNLPLNFTNISKCIENIIKRKIPKIPSKSDIIPVVEI